MKDGTILPTGVKYATNVDITLTTDHPIMHRFLRVDWEWVSN
jgi:hypothetical protein